MFHLSEKTGEIAPCGAASPDTCPYGTEEHFSTREAGEASLDSRFGAQALSGRSKPDARQVLRDAEAQLRENLKSPEARAEWEEAAIGYAMTDEGFAHFKQKASGMGLSAVAATHFLSEASRRQVQAFDAEDLAAALEDSPLPQVSNLSTRAPIAWDELDPRAQLHGTASTYVSDVVGYQHRIAAHLASTQPATADDLTDLLPAVRVYSGLRWSMAPEKRQERTYSRIMSSEEWRPQAEATHEYGEELATHIMDNSASDKSHFAAIGAAYGDEFALTHSRAPLAYVEDTVAERTTGVGSLTEKSLETCRGLRYSSNRLALYLSVSDPDTFHRQEAFHQVTVAGFDTLTQKDRLWMAKNLDKFPTSEGTVEVLKGSLESWARGNADQQERERLLKVLNPEEKPSRPSSAVQEDEGRRGIFRRRG